MRSEVGRTQPHTAWASLRAPAENVILLLLWCLWVVMLFWVQASIQEQRPFDPFEILGLDHTASDKEIKKAYRKLSLLYHPDKVRAAPCTQLACSAKHQAPHTAAAQLPTAAAPVRVPLCGPLSGAHPFRGAPCRSRGAPCPC